MSFNYTLILKIEYHNDYDKVMNDFFNFLLDQKGLSLNTDYRVHSMKELKLANVHFFGYPDEHLVKEISLLSGIEGVTRNHGGFHTT